MQNSSNLKMEIWIQVKEANIYYYLFIYYLVAWVDSSITDVSLL